MGDKQLAVIALELVKAVRANVTIDWTVKQGARKNPRAGEADFTPIWLSTGLAGGSNELGVGASGAAGGAVGGELTTG